MIKTYKFCELPNEIYSRLGYKLTIAEYNSLRELSKKTKVSINTLQKIRRNESVSIKIWKKLDENL